MSTLMNYDKHQLEAPVYVAWSLNGTEDVDVNQGPTPSIQTMPTSLLLNHSGQHDFTAEVDDNVHTSDHLNANLSIDSSFPELGPWGRTDAAPTTIRAWSHEQVSTGHLAGLHTSLDGIAMSAIDTLSGVSPTSGVSFATPLMTPDTSPTTPGLSPTIFGIPWALELLERELGGDINQIQDAIQDHSTNEDERTLTLNVLGRVDLQFISGDATLVSDHIIVKSVRTRPPHHGRSKDMYPQFTKRNWKNCPDLTSAAIQSGLLIADFPH
ncbi:hypothetical protein K435DRAFT_808974 [Dendrothele bispora CBS 962.96]|uniref:Uncharacterized protein n=1 Tax=Dendrothele bispora (strain CBS 962.96) TaxID=1314807 RepID=A0A4S8KZR7_DENBC|nr:hypothetical protein K435DRAFT_808974 [Dendrothele bispora CBS 962.96]